MATLTTGGIMTMVLLSSSRNSLYFPADFISQDNCRKNFNKSILAPAFCRQGSFWFFGNRLAVKINSTASIIKESIFIPNE
ncbi:hypothetical protein KJ750_00810 [Patescibacteria group bacterium]|nr:hypothetical protein [Patescibacteria group bacterium]